MNHCEQCGSWTTHRAWCPTNAERAARSSVRSERLATMIATLPAKQCAECMRDVRVSGDHHSWCKSALRQLTREEIASEALKAPPVWKMAPAYSQEEIDGFIRDFKLRGTERLTTITPVDDTITLYTPNHGTHKLKVGDAVYLRPDGTVSNKPSDGRKVGAIADPFQRQLFTPEAIGDPSLDFFRSPAVLSQWHGADIRPDESPDEFAARCRAMWPVLGGPA